MRTMNRNKQKLFYALFDGKSDILDEYGNKTGSYDVGYTTPVEVEMNISPARGTSDIEQFGINNPYTRSIVTDDINCPIATDSVLWIGIEPTQPYNYVVVSVAKSLNSITYAVKEVSVT